MTPLRDFVSDLRRANPRPNSPTSMLDAASALEILFLFEKPGPMNSKRHGGSGFISRNNDDQTAHATLVFFGDTVFRDFKIESPTVYYG